MLHGPFLLTLIPTDQGISWVATDPNQPLDPKTGKVDKVVWHEAAKAFLRHDLETGHRHFSLPAGWYVMAEWTIRPLTGRGETVLHLRPQ